MTPGRVAWAAGGSLLLLVFRASAAVTFEPHPDVQGVELPTVELRADAGRGHPERPWQRESWAGLDATPRAPGDYTLRFPVDGGKDGTTVLLPHCAGRLRVELDGAEAPSAPGPVVVGVGPGAHEVRIVIKVSTYERRLACGEAPRVGPLETTRDNLGVLAFDSPYASRGGGRAVVYVPRGHDPTKPAALLVGLHPWNGTMWTYAAYAQLLHEARTRDVLLLMPSGLGNSLYTADAEDEVLRAIDALGVVTAIDPRRVSLWGASMGGAGATTVGFHAPDRFAAVTSFFGDSKYDVTTYVRSILPDDPTAHLVNALDVVENAANLPVWLVHGIDDATSPIRQSELLADAMRDAGYPVQLTRVPHIGHAGALVARFLPEVVERAATLHRPEPVRRVAYRAVRPWDTGAYGVHLARSSRARDAVVFADARPDGVHVTRAQNVSALVLDPGAFGTDPAHPPPILFDGVAAITARWAQRTP
jgi:pimeloyl-ACP methyl ester carboxylesterase